MFHLLFVFHIAWLLPQISGHAIFMTSDPHCTTVLAAGNFIMAGIAISSTERSIVVTRLSTGEVLTSGSGYIPGESVSVQLSSTVGEYAFDTTAGNFTGGGCSGKRASTNSGTAATLVLPVASSGVGYTCGRLGSTAWNCDSHRRVRPFRAGV